MKFERITEITKSRRNDPLILRMIAAKKPRSCFDCSKFVNNRNAHPARISYCIEYPAMRDMVACIKFERAKSSSTKVAR